MPIHLRIANHSPVEADATQLPPELIERAAWIDLLQPTSDEVKAVEAALGIEIPTPEEMKEIESTSRLYCEHGIRVMNTPLLVDTTKASPSRTEVSFILAPQRLITLRERDSASFRITAQQFARGAISSKRDSIFISLLENIVDRQADMLERLSLEVDQISEKIFTHYAQSRDTEKNLREAIYALGRNGDLLARQRDCIASFVRLVQYAGHEDFDDAPERSEKPLPIFPRLKPVARDLQSLAEFSGFLTTKITFLLDATLGLINVEQNSIVKIFTVAAVIFLPPTLVASVYGMNFTRMPELDEPWGYPFAIGLMLLSVAVPYLFCRKKGWL